MRDLEHQQQVLFFDWLSRTNPKIRPFCFAIPNGGVRNIRTAVRLKAEGVTSGVFDIFAMLPYKNFHGIFIEFKAGKNKLTQNQKDFMERAFNSGYDCIVVYSAQEAIDYLKSKLPYFR